MTVEAWTRTPEYTISGIGPYTITHPYTSGAVRVAVRLDTGLHPLLPSEFSISPPAADTEGNLFLSNAAALAYAGEPLIIDRETPDEQGWLAVGGEREAGLEAQLNRMVQATQEIRAEVSGALRIRGSLDAFDWPDGTVPLRDGNRVIGGPNAADIAAAQTYAAAANVARMDAEAAAAGAATAALSAQVAAQEAQDAVSTITNPFTATENGLVPASGGGASNYLRADGTWAAISLAGLQPADPDLTALAALAAPGILVRTGDGSAAVRSITSTGNSLQITNPNGVAGNINIETTINQGTPVNSTSGTIIDFEGIPEWARIIMMPFLGVSNNGATAFRIQLGTILGIETSGYSGGSSGIGGASTSASNFSSGFEFNNQIASYISHGILTLCRLTGNTWVASGTFGQSDSARTHIFGGSKTLSGVLDRIRITAANGTSAFDAGQMNILWE